MKVALDINGVFTTQAGVARYIRGLQKGIQAVNPPDIELAPLAWEVSNFGYRQPARAIKTAWRELVWAPFLGPARLRALRAEVWHSTAGVLVRPPRGMRHVVTVCDLAVLHQRNRFRRWQRHSTVRRLRHLAAADRITTISQSTADECMRSLGIPASRIEVIHIGCDFHPDEPVPRESSPEFPVPDEFMLFVGSLEPGKNLSLLRRVYEQAAEKDILFPPLLIVGARWVGTANEGPPPQNWHYLGRQPDDVLVHLYRQAFALLFPSEYEGFGLPVAEAMALGCPVISSPKTSLPEVGGEAVRYADLHPSAWLAAMQKLLREPSLRQECVARGLEQARKFSWKRCGAATLELYRQVMRGG